MEQILIQQLPSEDQQEPKQKKVIDASVIELLELRAEGNLLLTRRPRSGGYPSTTTPAELLNGVAVWKSQVTGALAPWPGSNGNSWAQ
jgi:hypothetical protein